MKLIEAHVPDLYSFNSIVYVAVSFLVPLVLAYLANLMGWWVPLVSTAAWNAPAFHLISRMPRNAEGIRERYRTKYGGLTSQCFFTATLCPSLARVQLG